MMNSEKNPDSYHLVSELKVVSAEFFINIQYVAENFSQGGMF